MPITIAADTNVIVSAVWSEKGNCARILADVLDDKISLVCSRPIFDEYKDVLIRQKFSFPKRKIETLLSAIEEHAAFISVKKSSIPFLDEADRKFYDVIKEANAYLVTGNKKHFPCDSMILSPAEFLLFGK